MENIETIIFGFLIIFVLSFVIFLLIRELMCWYWKINEVIFLLKSINEKLTSKSSADNNNVKV
jgi:TM2 domain-containing membrane protein YozV